MKNKAHDVSSYSFGGGELILPDANIWLFLYSPATVALPGWRQAQIAPYSSAWSDLHSNDAQACLDPLVMCEVVNRLLDEEWARIDPRDARGNRRYPNRKKFRKSADYPTAAQSVESTARLILNDATPLDHPAKDWDLDKMLAEFGSSSTDWNDLMIVENCRFHGCKLLTDDSDHTEGGIDVITANPGLIAACS